MNVDQIKKELEVFKGVRLDEISHTYFITDSSGCTIQAKISMTTLISKYCRKFNTEEEAIRYANKYNKNVIDVLAEWEFENKVQQYIIIWNICLKVYPTSICMMLREL